MTVMLLGSSSSTTTAPTTFDRQQQQNQHQHQTSSSTANTIKQQLSFAVSSTASTSKPPQNNYGDYSYHHPPTLGVPVPATSSNYVDRLVNTTSSAMRYYRLWIYTCNAVLLASVFGFCVVVAWIFVSDPKRVLIPGLSLTQPSLLYAYMALSFQSGFLQFIGCMGAQRLNERLLNLYWLLILLLLIGDGLLGLLWIYRFEWIVAELRPFLKHKLNSQYGVDTEFTELWDDVQRELQCCGVDGPHDFRENKTHHEWNSPGVSEVESQEETIIRGGQQETILPNSCCLESPQMSSPVIAAALRNLRNFHYMLTTSTTTSSPPSTTTTGGATAITNASQSHVKGIAGCTTDALRCIGDAQFRHTGCEEKLLAWLRHTADIMFVLGYCVIAFLKLCFLGILRYEIKEMIQKIKILQGELSAGLEVPDGQPSMMKTPTAATVLNSSSAANRHHHQNNGRIMQTNDHTPMMHAGGRMMRGGGGDDSLQTTPVHHIAGGVGVAAAGGHNRHLNTVMSNDVDSDTNSHCALIIPEDPLTPNTGRDAAGGGGIKALAANNGNNNYELQEFLLTKHHRTQI